MRKFFNSRFGKILSIVLSVVCIGTCFVVTAFADDATVVQIDGDSAVEAAKGLFANVTSVLNFANIAKVLAIGIGAVIGIWLAWWGIRKLIKMLTNVLQRGKVSL